MDQEALLQTLLETGLTHCAASVSAGGGLIASLFLAGLLGSVSHCVGMCGPIVLAQVTARLECVPAGRMRDWHRLTGAALASYHAGRITVYGVLGAAAALMAGALVQTSGLRWISGGLLVLAAVLFLGSAIPRAIPRLPGWLPGWATGLAGSLPRGTAGPGGYGLGLVLGFIPCGLVYAALVAAAASADPVAGAAGMVAFGLGTVPSLLAVGVFGHLAAHRWRAAALRAAPVLMVVNAGVLAVMAWRLLV
ncbi:MAG: sulfite exporter TauE/SafE family protein [Alphaproteobacteria bacterium]|nr:sulfite exporter TauE/SafE family protein [Alphaproteobacteria bacterium]MBF0129478.1 sulfite exporter TauE/SafE family protein [Alphaproteobacteria bacterium]